MDFHTMDSYAICVLAASRLARCVMRGLFEARGIIPTASR